MWRELTCSRQCGPGSLAVDRPLSFATQNLLAAYKHVRQFLQSAFPIVLTVSSQYISVNAARLWHKANSAFHPHGVDKWVVSFISWCYNCSFSRGAPWRTTGKCRCGVVGRWSTPERIRGEVLTTMRYTNRRLPYLYLDWPVPRGWMTELTDEVVCLSGVGMEVSRI